MKKNNIYDIIKTVISGFSPNLFRFLLIRFKKNYVKNENKQKYTAVAKWKRSNFSEPVDFISK